MNALTENAPRTLPIAQLTSEFVIALARDCGADDAGIALLDDPALDEERPHILRAFPAASFLLSLVGRMHREPVRSPARSIANLEFHHAGDALDETARRIVRALEDRGVAALNPAMAFPMEMDDFPQRGWVVSHKRVAEAAGMGKMGIHRNLIHPKYGSFVLLGTVVIGAEVDAASKPLDFNPCMSCKLCVAACPVGAIKPDGYFDFSSCFNHNYQQFMGGFVNFVEDVAASRSIADYRSKQSYAETVSRWQSLAYGPNYNAAHCLAVCPAGEDVIGPYRRDKVQHRKDILDPLLARSEPVYVVKGGDAEDHVRNRFPHKRLRYVRSAARATTMLRLPVRHASRLPARQGERSRRRLPFRLHRAAGGQGDDHYSRPQADGRRGPAGNAQPGHHGRWRILAPPPRQGNWPCPSAVDLPPEAKGPATTAIGVWEMLSGLAPSALCQQFANVSNSSTRAERASAPLSAYTNGFSG